MQAAPKAQLRFLVLALAAWAPASYACLSNCGSGPSGGVPTTARGHLELTRPDVGDAFAAAFRFLDGSHPANTGLSFDEFLKEERMLRETGYRNPGGPGFINYAVPEVSGLLDLLPPGGGQDTPVVFFSTFADGPGEAAGKRMAEEAEYRRKADAEAQQRANQDRTRPVAVQLREANALREKLKKDHEEDMKDFGKEGHVPYWIDHVSASRLRDLDERLYGTRWPTPEQIAKGPTMKDEPKPPAAQPGTGSVLDTLAEPTPEQVRKVEADQRARREADAAAAKEQSRQLDADAQRAVDALFSGDAEKAGTARGAMRYASREMQNRVARKIVEHVQKIVDAGLRAAAGAPRTGN